MSKEWWKSKTLWFNILALIVAVAAAFGYGEFEQESWIGPAGAGIVTIINLVLRVWFTDSKLSK